MMLGSDSPQSPASPQTPTSYEYIYEPQYNYIEDDKEDDIYWANLHEDTYKQKYYRRKKYAYIFFFTIIVGMLFVIAVPDMYNIKTKKEFDYWHKILNIIVPNSDYYGTASYNIDPTNLSIIWYVFIVVCVGCMLYIYKLKPRY